jgi:hypothetical protein
MALSKPVGISHFYLDVNNTSAGYLSSFQVPSYESEEVNGGLGPSYEYQKTIAVPKVGDATAVFHVSQSTPLLEWISSLWKRDVKIAQTEVFLADQDYNVIRSVEMYDCLITNIDFPELKASDGKKTFDVTAKWKPTDLTFQKGSGKVKSTLGQKAKAWLVHNFEVHSAFGLNTRFVTSMGLPKISTKTAQENFGASRLPIPMYSSLEFSTVKMEIGRGGYNEAEALAVKAIKNGNFEKVEEDIIIDMLDPSLKKTLGTFELLGCTPKKFEWSPKLEGGKGDGAAVCSLEFLVQDFRFTINHK